MMTISNVIMCLLVIGLLPYLTLIIISKDDKENTNEEEN